MKKFLSEEELRRFALNKGASVSVGDAEFNTGRQRARVLPKPVVKDEPKPEVVRETIVVESNATVQALEAQTSMLSKLLNDLLWQLQQQPTETESVPVEWEFVIERDKSGLMQRIRAISTRQQVH